MISDRNQNDAEYVQQNDGDMLVIDFGELFRCLVQRLPILAIAAVIGGVIMAVYCFVWYQPKYQTSAKLYMVDIDGKDAVSYADLQLGDNLISDCLRVFEMKPLKDLAEKRLGEEYQKTMLNTEVSPTNPSNTHMIFITATSIIPENAQRVANAYAEAVCDFVESSLMAPRPTIIETAPLTTDPCSLSRPVMIALGILGGAFLAIAVITVVFIFDDRIKSVNDINNYLDLSCLGVCNKE